jgi:hypothetical protein
MTEQAQLGGEGMKAGNDPAAQPLPVQPNEPGNTDREKQPVLVAPGSGGCASCRQPSFTQWQQWQQQFQLFLSGIYWI